MGPDMRNPSDPRLRPTAVALWCLCVLALSASFLSAQEGLGDVPPAQAEAESDGAAAPADLPLPPALSADLLPPGPGTEAAARLRTPAEEVLAQFGSSDFGDAEASDEPLAPAAVRAVEDATQLLVEGRSFEAVARLREAERLAPDHPRVVRTLGLACVRGGNTVRGEAYLRRAAALDRADPDVRVVLARIALNRRAWADAAALAASIDQAVAQADTPDPAAQLFAQYARALAADRLGYPLAAIPRYEQVLASDIETGPTTAAGQELYILRQQAGTTRQRVGDLHLRLGDPARALAQYEQVDASQLLEPGGLAARLAYTHLAMGRPDLAAQAVVGFIASPAATEADAALIGYLVAQGAEPDALDALLVAAEADAPSGHFPLIAARSVVLPQAQTVVLIDAWLAQQPPRLASFRRAIALIRGGQDMANDPQALAHALTLTAAAMGREPRAAMDYADALLEQSIDPVALIRSLRRPELATSPRLSQQLLNAAAYVSVGRAADAATFYSQVLEQQPDHPHATRGMIEMLLALGSQDPQRFEEARLLLGDVQPGAEWDRFYLQVRLLRATGQLPDAQRFVRSRLRLDGQTLRLMLLSAELTLQAGDLRSAVPILLQAVEAFPTDERAYAAAADVILRADTLEEQALAELFVTKLREMLETHLPKSKTAQYLDAFWLTLVQRDPDAAIPVLEALLQAYPDEPEALDLLRVVYQVVGDQPSADEAALRRINLSPIGARRAIELARFYTGRDNERVTAIVRDTVALSEEGVLPGPPMTGGEAALLLSRLSVAVGEEAAEPDYLRAIRRFPNDPSLNNALAYRWAMAGKELLAAEAMLLRAIEHSEEEQSAYLDSLGWVYYKMGRFAEAEQYLRRAIARHRVEMREIGAGVGEAGASKAVHYDHMGDILYRLGESASAVRHWHIARGQTISEESAALDPETATVVERCTAKFTAVQEGRQPPVADVPAEAGFGSGVHPADRAP